MYLIREIFYCKPGKFAPWSRNSRPCRIMTDFCAEQYWTIVAEMEVPNLAAFENMMEPSDDMKQFEEIMKGYHDLVDHGKREIYKIEG